MEREEGGVDSEGGSERTMREGRPDIDIRNMKLAGHL